LKHKRVGVPQGAATSCSLSTLALSHITDIDGLNIEGCSIVMYADDGLIFLDDKRKLDSCLREFERSGVGINFSKSGWVKQDNT